MMTTGMTLLGWRAQPPTPYAHLLPARQLNFAAGRPRERLQKLQLPREHRFHRATMLHRDTVVLSRQVGRGGTEGMDGGASRPVPPSGGARRLRPVDRPHPAATAVQEPSPVAAGSPSPPALRLELLPPLAANSCGHRVAEPKEAPPPPSPGRSILSRGGVLPPTPRSLRPIGRRVELIAEPIVAPAALPTPQSNPRLISVNSQWGPPKTVRIEAPPKALPPPQLLGGAAKNSDWFNSFGNRSNRD